MQLSDLIGDRRVVTVSGAHKGAGKTALAEILLRNLQNFAAIKITITDDAVMVTDDDREIMTPSTDTCRMRKGGAVQVVWVRSTEDRLLDSMKVALGKMVPCNGILIEGNSILKYLNPSISFFVVKDTFAAMKPSRVQAIQKADVCVVNQVHGTSQEKELVQRIKELNPGLKVFSLNLLDPAGTDYNRLLALLSERIRV